LWRGKAYKSRKAKVTVWQRRTAYMKRPLKITLAVLVICVMGLFYGMQYLSMEFADGAYLEKMSIKKQ